MVSQLWADVKYHVPTEMLVLGCLMWLFYQEIMLSSGVFRRETASGFYPWGTVVSPRKRVAVGLCGWRHGNSFPTPQSAQSHRQMRSIPHCSKAVFMFLFLIPPTIRQQSIIYTQDFSSESIKDLCCSVRLLPFIPLALGGSGSWCRGRRRW